MSVRQRTYRDPDTGSASEVWVVDIDFQHADGRRERVRKVSPVKTRRGAEQYERDLRQALLNGTYGQEVKVIPTLSEFEERFLAYADNNNRPSEQYRKRGTLKNHLVPAFGSTRLDRIGPAEIEMYKTRKLKEGLLAKSVNNHLAVLRKLLNLAFEWREIPSVPKVRAMKVPEKDFQFFTFEEAERFLYVASEEWKPFLVVALKTGLRVGELLALKWEDVDLVAGRLVVRRTLWNGREGPPKGGKTREVPLSDQAMATLKAHRHLKGPYVFCDETGARLTHSKVKNVVPRTCTAAGLSKRLTTHDLRHTFASHLVMRGVTLLAVKELLGHATIDMTMRYAHLSPDVKRDSVQVLDMKSGTPSGTLTALGPVSEAANEETPGNSTSYRGQTGAGKGI